MLGKMELPVWVCIDSVSVDSLSVDFRGVDSRGVSGMVAVDCRGLADGQEAGSDGLMMGDGGRKAQAVFVMPVRSARRPEMGRATAFCEGMPAKKRGVTKGR